MTVVEREEATINRFLFVSEEDLELFKSWPPELRALFDPEIDRELARRIVQERAGREQTQEEGIPF